MEQKQVYTEQDNPIQRKYKLQQLREKRSSLEERMNHAVDNYLENLETYGEDHLITRFQAQMLNFLERLNEFSKIVLTMEESMQLVDEVMSTIDYSMDMINGCLMHNAKRYGFFDGIRQRYRMRRYWSTMQRRMKRINYVYKALMAQSDTMMRSVAKLNRSLNAVPGRKRKKGAPELNSRGLTTEVQSLIDKRAAERGAELPPAGAAPSPAVSGGDPGVDGLV